MAVRTFHDKEFIALLKEKIAEQTPASKWYEALLRCYRDRKIAAQVNGYYKVLMHYTTSYHWGMPNELYLMVTKELTGDGFSLLNPDWNPCLIKYDTGRATIFGLETVPIEVIL